jgi:hypothetical protein
MRDKLTLKTSLWPAAVIYSILLYFFYIKYVPQITELQAALIPVLSAVCILTIIHIQWGILFFLFMFPLINNLPYHFGIYEHIPHAPVSLVLFLFFFLGWLLYHSFRDARCDFCVPVIRPLYLFSLMIFFSACITALRFMNFYPFLSDAVYEWKTNVLGVTAGGAVMSTLFHALNYLTGFGFLLILFSAVRDRSFIKKIAGVLIASFFLALMVGYYQGFRDLGFGNTPFWTRLEQVNATFKDPNAFAAFLVVVFPLVLGMLFVVRGWTKIFPAVILGLSLFLFPRIGNRSSLLGLLLGILVLIALAVWKRRREHHLKSGFLKKPVVYVLILIVLGGAGIGFFSVKDSRLLKRFQIVEDVIKTRGSLVSISPERYFLWKEAVHMSFLYPLTGVGVGAFIIELPNYYSADQAEYKDKLEQFRRNDSAENYFLQILAELGWVGLIVSLWLFAAVLAGFMKVFRNLNPDEKDNPLYLGAIAAGAAYVPNIFFHSYIGSFEVKFIFWTMAAVIFSYGKLRNTFDEQKSNGNFIVLGTVLAVLFGAVYCWHSTHSLSLESRMEKFAIPQSFGLYPLENTADGKVFQWTQKVSGQTIRIVKPVLSIPLHASHPDIQENPVQVRIFLVTDFFKEKTLLGSITIMHSGWNEYEFLVPGKIGEEAILLIEASRTWNPMEVKGISDPRELGVAVGEIQFKPSKK